MWKYGPADMTAWIDKFKGQEVQPGDFSHRLAQDYRCRVFGRLVRAYSTRPPSLKRPRPGDDSAGEGAFDPDRDDGRG